MLNDPLGVQGQWRVESWQSPLISLTWMDPISLEGRHEKSYGAPQLWGNPWGHRRLHDTLENLPWLGCCKRILNNWWNWSYQHQLPYYPCSSEQLWFTNSMLRLFSGSIVVQGKLLGTFFSSIFFLDNHLIMFDFCGSMDYRKEKIVAVGLCNGIRFIQRKLVGRIGHSNWCTK